MLRIQDSELQELLQKLVSRNDFVFLDTACPDRENIESLLFLEPVECLVCRAGDDLENYLTRLQKHLNKGYYLAGWIGYEFGAMLESKFASDFGKMKGQNLVLADLGVFLEPCRFDHFTGENNFPFGSADTKMDSEYVISDLKPNMEQDEFLRVLENVQQYIRAGDTSQVNYTMKLLFEFSGSVEGLYSVLRKNQTVPYSTYIKKGEERILSFSPELFLRKTGDEITVRPMKGIASKGRCSTVLVDSLFEVESNENLQQMTSTIKAKSSREVMSKLKLTELFSALFPCGSITGAPKIKTMEIIDELEKEPRGVYTGAIGYFGPGGSAVFNVPVWTVRLQGNAGELGVGTRITHDSVPKEEWQESLLKGRFLSHARPEFQLFETILWQPGGGYWLLGKHLARLVDGAKYFKFSLDVELVKRILLEKEKSFSSNSCYRLRLVLSKDGQLSLTGVECDSPVLTDLPLSPLIAAYSSNGSDSSSIAMPVVAFAAVSVEAESPWLFHKTTMRQLYNEHFNKAQEEGLFDYLFCNTRGEVTEGCITNLIIHLDGEYLTPPVSCGLLPGTMRQKLLADQSVDLQERVLTIEDVARADALYLCNSVRGLVRVRLLET